MNNLNKTAFGGLFWLTDVLALLLFVPAWTLNYWQAWVFLAVFSGSAFLITFYLMKKDPKLLARRVSAGSSNEKETSQKIIQFLAQIAFIAVIIFPVLDHRFKWSVVPWYLVLAGDALILLGFYIVFLVFKENTFTSATIEVGTDQRVVSTGPYAYVRHPMYIGALVLLFGIPLALGSWWGLFAVIPITLVIVWRLLDEEKFLGKNLAGYPEYLHKVKYHLVPFVW